MCSRSDFCVAAVLALILPCGEALCESHGETKRLNEVYSGLTSGALTYAELGELPEGVLLKSGQVEVTNTDLSAELADAPESVREQLEKNRLFILENLATRELLVQAARESEAKDEVANTAEKGLVQQYLESVVAYVQVRDEEVARFYEENKDMCGGASLEQIRGQLKDYVLGQKKQEAVQEHIRTLGKRMPIVLAAKWVEEQAKLALDNPVDKARVSGKPSLVDFGSTGCRPCDMMAPILEDLRKQYEGKLNVLFVHVREEQVLASRYGIRSIPVQIFFDKDGKEVYRHTGFYAQSEIEKRLEEVGVK